MRSPDVGGLGRSYDARMTGTPAEGTNRADPTAEGFTTEERAAMKDRAQELKAAKRRSGGGGAAEDEADLLSRIAEMEEPDRGLARRIHELVMAAGPSLSPRTWYGMPAYAKDGKVVCFFKGAQKFKDRYATLGFNDPARLDDGAMWPTSYALTELTPAVEERITALVRRAVS